MEILDANLQFRGTSPNGGTQKLIDTIVVHHRAGNGDVQSIHNQHLAKGWWGIGYHYYIRKNGEIWRGRRELYVGSHAGSSNTYNTHSIGICFEGNFETEQMTDAQVKAGRELIADIKARHPIKKIIKHKDIAATACPGKNFRMAELTAKEPDDYGTPTTIKIGTALITGKILNGVTYVPLNEFVKVMTQQLRVELTGSGNASVVM